MPVPPDFDLDFELPFITNYMLAGCDAPQQVIFELSAEPLANLAMLFIQPEVFDIAQSMFDPRKKRRRKPGRHGGKSSRAKGIPDISDMIGDRLHVDEVVQPLTKLPGLRYVMPVLNTYEFINFGAAVLDQVEDTIFNPLYMLMKIDHQFCNNLDRLMRTDEDRQVTGGAGQPFSTLNCKHIDTNEGFFDSFKGTAHGTGPYAVGFTATMKVNSEFFDARGQLALHSDRRGIVAVGPYLEVAIGQSVDTSVNARFDANEFCSWGWLSDGGFIDAENCSVFAYGESGWLDWTKD